MAAVTTRSPVGARFAWIDVVSMAYGSGNRSTYCMQPRAPHRVNRLSPDSTPSVGPGADPGVQAVSLQVTVSHSPGGRLPLLSARPAVTSPAAAEHRRPAVVTKLYCLVTEAHRCEQLAQGCYAALPRVGYEPATYWSQVQRCTTAPPYHIVYNFNTRSQRQQ